MCVCLFRRSSRDTRRLLLPSAVFLTALFLHPAIIKKMCVIEEGGLIRSEADAVGNDPFDSNCEAICVFQLWTGPFQAAGVWCSRWGYTSAWWKALSRPFLLLVLPGRDMRCWCNSFVFKVIKLIKGWICDVCFGTTIGVNHEIHLFTAIVVLSWWRAICVSNSF